jgi:3'-phosphoadenosine 5'-phosphosulfate sulfotransferase (PAPS reductase)/FAD synthetase
MHKERIKASKRPLVCSVSGGKDSIATALWLRENGFEETNPIFYVFADTGWEHPSLYKYLDEVVEPLDEVVEPLLGENFHRVKSKKHPGGMAELAESRGMFPSRMIRFCTQELKVFPIRDFIASLDGDPINIVGIRAQESLRRSKMDEWEPGGPLGVDTWRPLIDWLVEDVIEIHQRHNIKPCSLYLRDKLPASRVGCYPCIMSRKDEIRALTQDDFGLVRIGQIRDLEQKLGDAAQERNPDNTRPTFFQSREQSAKNWPIDDVIAWSKTSHGGKQIELFVPDNPSERGCQMWGLCDLPDEDGEFTA